MSLLHGRGTSRSWKTWRSGLARAAMDRMPGSARGAAPVRAAWTSGMNLSTRLMAAMVTLVLVAAAAVGMLTYRNIEAIALPSALERMEMHTRILATELEAPIIAARADVNTQGRLVQGVVRASLAGGRDPLDGTPEAQWRSALASRFTAELAAKLAYARFGASRAMSTMPRAIAALSISRSPVRR